VASYEVLRSEVSNIRTLHLKSLINQIHHSQTTWIESCDTLELMDTLLEGISENGKKDIIDMRTHHSVKSVHLGIVDAVAPFFTSCSNALQQMNVKVTIGVGDTLCQLDLYRWEIGSEEHRAFDIVYLGNSA
jgi:hypothetical protein